MLVFIGSHTFVCLAIEPLNMLSLYVKGAKTLVVFLERNLDSNPKSLFTFEKLQLEYSWVNSIKDFLQDSRVVVTLHFIMQHISAPEKPQKKLRKQIS